MDPPPYYVGRYEEDGDDLVIALDFGTTFSGVAYAFSTDPDKIHTITNWPGGEDRIAPKTPTTIQYAADSTTSFKWGYELEISTGNKITALKLLLDPDQDLPHYAPVNVKAGIAKLPKSALEVASDYMKAIYDHALKEIESDLIDKSFLDGFRKKFMLTVPAVWSDKAKSHTLQAARSAGIDRVEMITEPEAAALYTLHSSKNKGLDRGDSFVICDAGGGTVDLVSYEIQSLDPFELKALTTPTGGVCGSIMLNERFEEEVRKTVGDEAYSKLKHTDAYRSAIKTFDGALKLAFRGKKDSDRFVSFPMAALEDNKPLGLISNSMTLSGSTMFSIFDPVIRDIDRLVSGQVAQARREAGRVRNANVRAIFLVGGFGSSAYLKGTIEKSNPGIMVIQPREAWSAIVRGAVMSKLGLAPMVVATKAPKHFGTSANSRWSSYRDVGYPKIRDEWNEVDLCYTMSWFIYKNDDLVRDKKIKLPFTRKMGGINPSGDVLCFTDELYECDSILPPDHPENVKVNCVLKTDLNDVPKSAFVQRKRHSDDAVYTEIRYQLVVENNSSGLMKFSLELDGKEYSAVEASY